MTAIDAYVGARLQMRRMFTGLTRADLGDRAGVDARLIEKFESGAVRITAGRLFVLSDALGVPPGWFFEGLELERNRAA